MRGGLKQVRLTSIRDPDAAQHDWRLGALAMSTLLSAAIVWFVFGYGYIEDDAFIHLEFARSVADGSGFSFNGHVVYGDTAPLWVLILVGIHSLGLGWIASAKLACAGGLAATLAGAWRLGRELAALRPFPQEQPAEGACPDRHTGKLVSGLPAAAVLVTLLNPYLVHWSFSGMEAVSALGLTFWIIALGVVARPSARRILCAALLIAVAPLLRPELLLLEAIVAPVLLWRIWQHLQARPVATRLPVLAAAAIVMAAPLAVWSSYALHTFGALVPNTNLAKRGGGLRELVPRMLSVYAVGFPLTLLFFALVAPRLLRLRIPLAIAVMLLWPLGCIVFYLANHTVVQTRYVLISMPTMSIALLWLIGRMKGRRPLIAAAGSMAAAGALVVALIVVPHVANKVRYVQLLSRVAGYLRDTIPPHEPVAIFAIGQVAFESRHPLVDIGGITDRSVLPYIGSPVQTCQWARAHGARYYISGDSPQTGAEPVFTATAPFIGWTFRHSQYSTRQPLVIYRLP